MSRLRLLMFVAVAFALSLSLCAQEPQSPPPQPSAGAANGPQPGPAVKTPGTGDRQGAPAPAAPAARPGGHGDFLAIGPLADPAAATRGQKVFVANCAFCHGSDAHGGNGGPDLVRSVLVLHDKGAGVEIAPVILKGRPAKGMPAFPLSEAQIKDLAAFLLSRNQAAANRMEYKILNIVTGDPKAGEAYFAAHCAACHSPAGDLAHIAGKFEPVDLQARFLYPREPRNAPAATSRAAKTATVTLLSGTSVSGRVDHLDDFSISLVDASGVHHSWLFDDEKGIKVEVNDPLKAHAELLKQYTNADMHNILAYLETLK